MISSRSCICADSYGCNLAVVEQRNTEIYVFPGFKYIKRAQYAKYSTGGCSRDYHETTPV